MISKEFLKKIKPFSWFLMIASFLAVTIAVVLIFEKKDWFWPTNLKPELEIIVSQIPEKIKLGESYPVAIKILNKGGNSLKEKAAFSGLHIEVANAKVKNIRAFSPSTGKRVVIKSTAQRGDIYWFEAAYDFLGADQWGLVLFDLIPNNPEKENVNIWYRGWSPSTCSLSQRWAASKDLVGKYRTFQQGWRNENCIIRYPSNNDEREENCQVDVYAAHEELQIFRCFKKTITRE